MKKYIVILIVIIILGGLTIYNPFDKLAQKKEAKNIEIIEKEKEKEILDISSNLETIEDENENTEMESFDSQQIYFENTDILYNNFKFGQVEDIKQEIQSYIHQYISPEILDCKIITDSFHSEGNIYNFNLEIENVKEFKVEVILKDECIDNISFSHTL